MVVDIITPMGNHKWVTDELYEKLLKDNLIKFDKDGNAVAIGSGRR